MELVVVITIMVTCTKDSGLKGKDMEKGPHFCKVESDT